MGVVNIEEILQQLWDMYGKSIYNDINLKNDDNNKLIDEFFFIVLGGYGISYEQNISGLKVLREKGFYDSSYYLTQDSIEATARLLRNEFNERQFEPKTRDGNYRKYRFIETKSYTVAKAGYWLWHECRWDLLEKLNSLGACQSRDWLRLCPGFGLKSASWFLRNTGFNLDCAVFDVHVIRFLKKMGFNLSNSLSERTYLDVEDVLRKICAKMGVSLGKIDYLLWILGRNGYLSYIGGAEN